MALYAYCVQIEKEQPKLSVLYPVLDDFVNPKFDDMV